MKRIKKNIAKNNKSFVPWILKFLFSEKSKTPPENLLNRKEYNITAKNMRSEIRGRVGWCVVILEKIAKLSAKWLEEFWIVDYVSKALNRE